MSAAPANAANVLITLVLKHHAGLALFNGLVGIVEHGIRTRLPAVLGQLRSGQACRVLGQGNVYVIHHPTQARVAGQVPDQLAVEVVPACLAVFAVSIGAEGRRINHNAHLAVALVQLDATATRAV